MKRQYKSIDDINQAQKEMNLQCRTIESEALNFFTSPTGLLMDLGLGLISKKGLFKKKQQKNTSSTEIVQLSKANSNTSPTPSLLNRTIRYASKVFIKYQLLNLGIWTTNMIVKQIKKKKQLKQIEKASKELDTLLAKKQIKATS